MYSGWVDIEEPWLMLEGDKNEKRAISCLFWGVGLGVCVLEI